MRLTLRTLLAYLDDRLSPANARELGQKISASPYAKELAERIRGVVRKRRLASDQTPRKIIDGNLIAEYLDDQLTPELVALLETAILSSDHSLAEVAATHQILGLLADPQPVSEKLKHRLYKLAPSTDQHAAESITEAEVTASETWKPLAPAPTAPRRSPMILLVVMILGWLVLLFLDQNLYRSTDTAGVPIVAGDADNNNQPDRAAATDNAASPDDDLYHQSNTTEASNTNLANNNPLAGDDSVSEGAAGSQAADVAAKSVPASNSPAIAMADSGARDGEPNAAGQPVGEGSRNEDSATKSPANADGAAGLPSDLVAGTDTEPAKPTVEARDVFSPHLFFVTDPNETLMLSARQSKPNAAPDLQSSTSSESTAFPAAEWSWATDVRELEKNNWNNLLSQRIAAIAEPFRIDVGCEASGWVVRAIGSSVFRGIDEKFAGLIAFEGRYVIRRTVCDDPEPFLLQVTGQQLLIDLPETDQSVAITINPVSSQSDSGPAADGSEAGFPSTTEPQICLVTLTAIGKPCQLMPPATDQPVTLQAGRQIQWLTSDQFPTSDAASVLSEWDWVADAEMAPNAGRADLLVEYSTALKQSSSVERAVRALSENRNPMLAAWSVEIPAVQRDISQLVSLLFESEQQVVREAAFLKLQELVRLSGTQRKAVEDLLQTRLNQLETYDAMRLLGDITKISLEDRLTSEWLIELLSSDRLVIREMAISTLDQHLNDRNDYYADEESSRRTRAIKRWKSELNRRDGRLVTPLE